MTFRNEINSNDKLKCGLYSNIQIQINRDDANDIIGIELYDPSHNKSFDIHLNNKILFKSVSWIKYSKKNRHLYTL